MRFIKILPMMIVCLIGAQQPMLENIYQKIILLNIEQSIRNTQSLIQAVKKQDIQDAKDKFAQFIYSYKAVETLYILHYLDED